MKELIIIGGGLAGSEAAWQAATRGINVILFEMRPTKMTGAHTTSSLAELVCSNSFGSCLSDRPSGILINELDNLGSLLISCAKEARVPAGHALALDRLKFSKEINDRIFSHPNIKIVREEIKDIPEELTIIATGPLTSHMMANALSKFFNSENLFFYDAISPSLERESVNMEIAFWGSRYNRNQTEIGDYINCPFNKSQYDLFVEELCQAKRYPLKTFESKIGEGVRAGKGKYFEGCLPIEEMAKRGLRTLAFGPLRPVGLTNPHTDEKPYAVVQLRQEDISGEYLNMVGFQTNLLQNEQERVFHLIPGLEDAKFVKYGQMHKNTYIFSPGLLNAELNTIKRNDLFIAGQILGVEGYLACIGTGLLAGINASRMIEGKNLLTAPPGTMLGALCKSISDPNVKVFQPVKESFGILPSLETQNVGKKIRHQKIAERAREELSNLVTEIKHS